MSANFLVSAALVGCGHVSALLARDARTRQMRACCRYQCLVLYWLVQRGSSLVIPVSAFRKAGKNDAF